MLLSRLQYYEIQPKLTSESDRENEREGDEEDGGSESAGQV